MGPKPLQVQSAETPTTGRCAAGRRMQMCTCLSAGSATSFRPWWRASTGIGTGRSRQSRRNCAGSSWRTFDPGRDMPDERGGRNLLYAPCRFIKDSQGNARGWSKRANIAVCTCAAGRSCLSIGAFAVCVIRTATLLGHASMLMFMLIFMGSAAHRPMHRQALMHGVIHDEWMMRHAALELRYPRNALHWQGGDEQVKQEMS